MNDKEQIITPSNTDMFLFDNGDVLAKFGIFSILGQPLRPFKKSFKYVRLFYILENFRASAFATKLPLNMKIKF